MRHERVLVADVRLRHDVAEEASACAPAQRCLVARRRGSAGEQCADAEAEQPRNEASVRREVDVLDVAAAKAKGEF